MLFLRLDFLFVLADLLSDRLLLCRYAACVVAMLPDVGHNQCAQQFEELQKCVRQNLLKR